jgi:hypothetical protein
MQFNFLSNICFREIIGQGVIEKCQVHFVEVSHSLKKNIGGRASVFKYSLA